MPTKEIEITSGALYFRDPETGEYELISDDFDSVAVDIEPEIPEAVSGTFTDPPTGATFTIVTSKLNRNTFLSLALGRVVSNNWLKMHGGVMTRKSRRKHIPL